MLLRASGGTLTKTSMGWVRTNRYSHTVPRGKFQPEIHGRVPQSMHEDETFRCVREGVYMHFKYQGTV